MPGWRGKSREEGWLPPAPPPPMRRGFCLVPLCSQRGSWLKDEYVWVTLRWIGFSPNRFMWSSGYPLLLILCCEVGNGSSENQWTSITNEEKRYQSYTMSLGKSSHFFFLFFFFFFCHTQMYLSTVPYLALSLDFSDPPATHYPFYNTLQQILIHNQTSYPILVAKIT